VKAWVIEVLRRLIAWLEGPPAEVPPSADPITVLADHLTRRADALGALSGEYKRHWAYARLIKAHPEARRRDLSLAIELALQARGDE
jgi:hypothetical protein